MCPAAIVWTMLVAGLPWCLQAAEAEKPVEELKGLIVWKSQDALLKEDDPALAVTGLQVKDIPILQSGQFGKAIQPFLGRKIDETLLKDIQATVRKHYRQKGFPVVDPVFPPQTVSRGVLQMVVIESKLGKLIFEGTNTWTKTEYLRKNLRAQEGEPISENKLIGDLHWLGRNKFRSVDALYKPGEQRFESDLVIRTSDRLPLGGSVGIDNTGNRLTGETRLSASVDWGKAFGFHDHILSYRFVTDSEFEFLKAHVMNYAVFLPWRHTLSLSGSYADIKGNIPNLPITQQGTSYQASLHYGIPLPNLRSYRHEFMAGLDFRHLDNNLEFNFVNVLADTTEIGQGMLGYTGMMPDDWGSTFLGLELYYSPGNLSGENTDSAFSNSYPFAEADYTYAKFNLERVTRLWSGFSWRISGTYQIADGNLVPSEQLGLGGAYTIRGYEERTASGTEGFVISNELRSPSFSLGRWLDKTAKDELQVLGFFDYGQTSNRILQPREDPHVLLKSAGAGLRYQISRFLSVRFDYGWQLEDSVPGLGGAGKSRGHITASYSF
ncbi:MAG: ShlB/FhaC/HecB family hemolysin secretion/activation protein [Verrucomicrobia bacterium]|nr:ShlB/FhaC/HecB family hemolysin secretion/activation protein [Verrucomicrobiota bacterium]